MKARLFSHLKVIVSVGLSLVLGKLIAQAVGGLPGSLYGMLIFAMILAANFVDSDEIGAVVETYISYMPIVFVPVCLGIIEFGDLFLAEGWRIVVLGVALVLTVMSLTALLSNYVLQRNADD